MQKTTHSVFETKKFAQTLAKKCRGGEIFGLIGDLGSGKTAFSQGFAQGLGIARYIPSPTFTVLNVYPTARRSPIRHLCHADLYRLPDTEAISEIGLAEWLGRPDTITLIEWADRMRQPLRPYRYTAIHFQVINHATRRLMLQVHRPRR